MVTANAATSNEGTGGTDLNFYNWVPATGFTSPNDDAAKDPRYSSASVPPPPAYSPNPPPPATLEPASSSSSRATTVVPDEAIVPPKNNDEDHKNEEAPQVPTEAPAPVAAQPNPRSDPTPSKITHLATTNVPELERLSDVFVHNIAHTHHSRNFFVACQPVIHTPPDTQLPSLLSPSSSEASSQPPADEAVLMSSNLDNFSVPSTTPQDVTIPIRVVKKDGGVMSNDIRMVDLEARNDIGGLARRWKKSDTMMFDPWSGRIVAVTANDIIVWQF
ncbi:hypothetical protein DL93DRAFT_1122349 [Clavulina sp. PMI_390]|nr:hypothetical protein DL93DRAFT_1122349 [Clavulina sp. PMI_390]